RQTRMYGVMRRAPGARWGRKAARERWSPRHSDWIRLRRELWSCGPRALRPADFCRFASIDIETPRQGLSSPAASRNLNGPEDPSALQAPPEGDDGLPRPARR